MAVAARDAMGKTKLQAVADRGYYSGPQIKACHDAGIAAILPKSMTSNAKAEGRFDKGDFIYIARDDEYKCPAGQRAIHRSTREENGMQIRRYWSSACPQCPLKAQCTPSDYRRISRWEHETVLEGVQRRLDKHPDAMMLRRRTVEHVFGTLKHWMGSTHFLTRRLANVRTEMSLHVLAYNLKRVISLLGIAKTMKAMRLLGPEPLCHAHESYAASQRPVFTHNASLHVLLIDQADKQPQRTVMPTCERLHRLLTQPRSVLPVRSRWEQSLVCFTVSPRTACATTSR